MILLTDEEILKVGDKGDELYSSDDYLLRLLRLIAKAQLRAVIKWLEPYTESHEQEGVVDFVGVPYKDCQALHNEVKE